MTQAERERTERKAYELWECRGRPEDGSSEVDWRNALFYLQQEERNELLSRIQAMTPSRQRIFLALRCQLSYLLNCWLSEIWALTSSPTDDQKFGSLIISAIDNSIGSFVRYSLFAFRPGATVSELADQIAVLFLKP